jgi:hypothetical protein
MKSFLKKVIHNKILGQIDYYRIKFFSLPLGEPFNGQTYRQQIFLEIIRKLNPLSIIETGTFRGTSTIYMHLSSNLPIHTIEVDRRYYTYSKKRFKDYPQIKIYYSNSVEALNNLINNKELVGARLFFYLDAHWDWYLPLEDELKIIFNNWINSIVMVDDFQVPDDPGYGYDNYSNGKALDINLLNSVSELQLGIFLPKEKGIFETGARKGSIILAKSPEIINKLKSFDTLRSMSIK